MGHGRPIGPSLTCRKRWSDERCLCAELHDARQRIEVPLSISQAIVA